MRKRNSQLSGNLQGRCNDSQQWRLRYKVTFSFFYIFECSNLNIFENAIFLEHPYFNTLGKRDLSNVRIHMFTIGWKSIRISFRIGHSLPFYDLLVQSSSIHEPTSARLYPSCSKLLSRRIARRKVDPQTLLRNQFWRMCLAFSGSISTPISTCEVDWKARQKKALFPRSVRPQTAKNRTVLNVCVVGKNLGGFQILVPIFLH